MNKTQEALKMAIEFMEETATFVPHSFDLNGIAVVNACKAALSENEAISLLEQVLPDGKATIVTQIDAVKFQEALDAMCEDKDKQIVELQAQINELREALEETKTFLDFNIELVQTDEFGNVEPANSYSYELYRYVCFINESLAKTAPQCLQEHDNEVIEMCAKICDEMNNEYGWGKVAANTIRLLKGKQNETT